MLYLFALGDVSPWVFPMIFCLYVFILYVLVLAGCWLGHISSKVLVTGFDILGTLTLPYLDMLVTILPENSEASIPWHFRTLSTFISWYFTIITTSIPWYFTPSQGRIHQRCVRALSMAPGGHELETCLLLSRVALGKMYLDTLADLLGYIGVEKRESLLFQINVFLRRRIICAYFLSTYCLRTWLAR